MTRRTSQRSFPLWPWVLLVLWLCVIWGHSLMSGEDSGNESQIVVELVRRVAYKLYASGNPLVLKVTSRFPGILGILENDEAISFYVRKAAHFTEYFVLGVLAFNAVRLTFAHPLISLAVIGTLWMGVPNIDETIQRFTPGRAGMFTDTLIDMAGFGLALSLCLLLWLVAALLRALFSPMGADRA